LKLSLNLIEEKEFQGQVHSHIKRKKGKLSIDTTGREESPVDK